VGLHRASWLLFTFRERLRHRGVLVVGPNPLFMEYVSHVLPALGEDAVEQRSVDALLDDVHPTRLDAPDAAALKAGPRLAEVVQRAVELAVKPAPEELVLYLDGEFVKVREREVAGLLEEALTSDLPLAAARERFRLEVVRRFYGDYGRQLGSGAYRSGEEIESVLRRNGRLAKWLGRVLPVPRADVLVRRLLTSPTALAAAADGILDPVEQRLLLRDRPRKASELEWSVHDLPLVDEARSILEESAPAFAHVIVDEAQDLSPMQLRMIARRSASGAATILGDIAQATGPVSYRSWDEVAVHLGADGAVRVEELRHAYRVPAEIMDLALPLLEQIAPDVAPPIAYRAGGEPPRFLRVGEDELLAAAVREASALAEQEGLFAIVAPASVAATLPSGHVFEETEIPVLTPRSAKGLEFDHVLVVEPAAIVEEGGRHGLRELYVALTRPTKTLVVLHARPLPPELRLSG
jgi:DNA helicase IV